MSRTVFHEASRTWLSAACAAQLDAALAAARAVGHNCKPVTDDDVQDEGTVPASKITAAEWVFVMGPDAALLQRLDRSPLKLGQVADLFVGIQTDADDVFIRGGYIALNRQYIENIPIRPIDFDNQADVALHDKMVSLVERMLELNRKKAAEQPGDLAPPGVRYFHH